MAASYGLWVDRKVGARLRAMKGQGVGRGTQITRKRAPTFGAIVGAEEAALAEEAGAVLDALDHVDLHGLGRNLETLGDFFVGEAVEVAEHHHLAATFGQGENSLK